MPSPLSYELIKKLFMSDIATTKKNLDDQIETLMQDIKRRKEGLNTLNKGTEKLAKSGMPLDGHPEMDIAKANEEKLILSKENDLKKLFEKRIKLLGQ